MMQEPKIVILAKSTIILECVDPANDRYVLKFTPIYWMKQNQKGAQKKKRNSRHIPYPDWIQNVTVTCKRSHFHEVRIWCFYFQMLSP